MLPLKREGKYMLYEEDSVFYTEDLSIGARRDFTTLAEAEAHFSKLILDKTNKVGA